MLGKVLKIIYVLAVITHILIQPASAKKIMGSLITTSPYPNFEAVLPGLNAFYQYCRYA